MSEDERSRKGQEAQGQQWPEDDELSLGDGRLELEAEDQPAHAEANTIPLTEAFNGDYQDVLLDADQRVTTLLNELTNACWYSSAVILARQPLVDNQPLFDEWVRDHIGEEFDVVTISADLLMTPDELLEEVLEELEPATGEREEEEPGEALLAALNRHNANTPGQHPRELVVQVEHAHELGERALQSLVALVAGHETMITPHIILWWGDGVTQDSLAEGNAVHVTRLDFPPFSRQAVVEYLRFCWGQYSAEALPLDEGQIDTIIKASGGVADAMDGLALAELREESAPAREGLGRLLPRGLPWRHGMIAGALVLVLAMSFFLRGGGDDDDAENTSIVRVERSLPEASGTSPGVEAGTDSTDAGVASVSGGNTVVGESEEAAEDIAVVEPAPDTGETVATGAAGEAVDTGPAAPQSEPPPAQTEQTAAVDNNADNADESSAAGAPEADTARTELEQVADERFFIQLLGSHSIETATNFMADHDSLDGEDRALHRFEARHQGRPWHVVIHGPYQDRAAAETAMEGLPRALRSASPWVRSMADIRSTMTR